MCVELNSHCLHLVSRTVYTNSPLSFPPKSKIVVLVVRLKSVRQISSCVPHRPWHLLQAITQHARESDFPWPVPPDGRRITALTLQTQRLLRIRTKQSMTKVRAA